MSNQNKYKHSGELTIYNKNFFQLSSKIMKLFEILILQNETLI